jgi:hypothetical protein
MERYNENISNEKNYFSQQRLRKLNQLDFETRKNILRLENTYGKFCFLPLDIPIIKNDDFYQWYFETASLTTKQNLDVATSTTGVSSFYSLDIVPESLDLNKTIWTKNVVKNFDKLWPDLWDQFHEYLPYEKIIGLSMWSSIRDIIPHRDQTMFLDLPLEFRILFDKNPEDNLFVSEILPDAGPKNFLQTSAVPTQYTTNTFAWSNLRSQHHSIYNNNYKKIIFIFQFLNPIDWKKYEKLIEKSIEKYQFQSLISKNSIDDFVFTDYKKLLRY